VHQNPSAGNPLAVAKWCQNLYFRSW